MNNENNIKRDDKLDLVSMVIGIVTLPIILLGLLFDVILFPIFIAPIVGFIFGVVSENKNKKRTIGIVLNSITFVLMFILFIGVLLAMSTDSQVGDDYEANKTFTNLSMYIPEDWMEAEEEDWGFNSAKTYVYRNFEYIDNWENTDLETDIIKGGEKNKKSLCEITIKDYSETYKLTQSFTNQNYSDSEKYKLNKESFDISKNDILLEEKLTKKEFNDIEFEYAVDKSTNSKIHYYFLDAGSNGLYEIVIWDMKNCDKYIKHIEESFELDESSSNNVQNDNEINNEATENDMPLNYYEYLEDVIKNSYMQLSDLQFENSNEITKIANKLWKYAFITSWGKNIHYEYDEIKQISKITNFDEVFNYFTEDFEISVMNTISLTKKSFYEYEENDIYYGYNAPNERGANYLYRGSTNAKLVENLEDTISFEVISKYCSNENWNPNLSEEECSTMKEVANKFVIQKEDDYWKIKYFVLPN